MARIVFLGTGDIALPTFRWLLVSSTPPIALVTQPDRPAGRHRELKAPAIKLLAEDAGVAVLQPEKVRDPAALEALEALQPDLIVVMAYGQILPQRLLDMAPLGCVNLHASLLPKYRGAACIQAALDAGDAETGMTLMHVIRQLDAGDVILSKRIPIGARDTGGSLHDRLAEAGVEALAEGLPLLLDGSAPRTPQDELGESSHIPKLGRDDGRIDWSWPAARIERRLRAYDPWPGCSTSFNGRRLKIFPFAEVIEGEGNPGEVREIDGRVAVACGDGALTLDEVQPDGSRRMSALDWWRGQRLDVATFDS
ncbi:methionyl-tRNA formyltransferase [Haloferula sp. A504]|uniref:methionyl-tRNA formyltransferase n=1 Tax=Haloferula sp. A504 TaxID=3373601 RepID=UPI0031C60439|nr:methionyl-tRNA formyltransferase [Verrucomicrobiaceae bacterium E54]